MRHKILERLLDALPVAVLLWKKDKTCFFTNKAARHMGMVPEKMQQWVHNSRTVPEALRVCLKEGRLGMFAVDVPLQALGRSFFMRIWPLTRSLRFCLMQRNHRVPHEAKAFQSFVAQLPTPTLLVKKVGGVLDANSAFLSWSGLSTHEELQTRLAHISADTSAPYTFDFLDKAGCYKSALVSHAWPVDDMTGSVALFITPVQKKRSVGQKALAGTLIEAVALPVVIVNTHNVVVFANRLFEKLIAERTILGRLFSDWIAPEAQELLKNFLQEKRLQTGEHLFFDVPMTVMGGVYCRLYAHVFRHDSDDNWGHVLIAVLDLTDAKRKEAQIKSAEKLQIIGQLSSGISHDFNNLLTAMIGFCDLLLQRHGPQDRSFTDIMQIKQNANRAAGLIRQLLRFAKEESTTPAQMDLRACLSEMSFVLRRLLGPAIDLRMEHNRRVRMICADQIQIEQIIMNLAVNARDAMPRGGALTFRTHAVQVMAHKTLRCGKLTPGDYLVLDVCDTGTGIDHQTLEKMFDPFFSTKGADVGTGLGLATVKEIMENANGGIEVVSELNYGTTFRLYFPRVAEQVATRIREELPRPVTAGFGASRILLVEDEDPVRLFTARALRSKGYEVFEARDGQQGLDLLKRTSDIRLVITDVMMAGMAGPQLASACYHYQHDLLFLFVSGYPEDSIQLPEELPKKQVHFLPKPFNLDSLTSRVFQILGDEKKRA